MDSFGDPIPEGAEMRLGTVRLRHGNGILGLSWSPDGKWIASGGGAYSSGDDGVRIWDVSDGRLLRTIREHKAQVMSVAFSPDGAMLATAGYDGTIRLWDTAGWKERARIPHASIGGGVFTLCPIRFSRRGEEIAAYEASGKLLRVFDARSGAQRVAIARGQLSNEVVSIDLSPDGALLGAASVHGGVVETWSVPTGAKRAMWSPPKEIHTVAVRFSPDGRTLAVGTTDHRLRLLDAGALRERASWNAGGYLWTGNVDFSPDGKRLACYVGGMPPAIRVWDAATGAKRVEIPWPGSAVTEVAFSPDGKLLAACGDWRSGAIRIWDAETGQERRPFPAHSGPVDRIAVSPDGSRIATAGMDATIRVWDASTGGLLRTSPCGDDEVSALQFAPGGGSLVCGLTNRRFGVLELGPPGTLRAASIDSPGFQCQALTQGGECLAVSYLDHSVGLVGIPSAREVVRLRGHEGTVWRVSPSPDGTRMASVSEDGSVRLWDLAGGRQIWCVRPEKLGESVALSPDGRCVAADKQFDALMILGAESGREFYSLGDEGLRAGTACFSPDGRLLAVGTRGGAIPIWETATGGEILRLDGHGGEIRSLAFLPDGRRLASGSDDTTALVWSLAPKGRDGRVRPARLGSGELERLWSDLGDEDASRAHEAVWRLASAPRDSLPFPLVRLPAVVADPARLRRLVQALDDDDFTAREGAAGQLELIGEPVRSILLEAAGDRASGERRSRAAELLRRLDRPRLPIPPGEDLRAHRAVWVLEMVGTPEARAVLEGLARGAPSARLTGEARAALQRLATAAQDR